MIDDFESATGRTSKRRQKGARTLEATKRVGVQVLGYAESTSYHYPGGLNLAQIGQPPVTP